MHKIKAVVGLLFLVLLLACTGKRQPVEYVPFKQSANDKWGFIAADGKVALKGLFAFCPSAVVNDRFCVQNNNGYWMLYSFTTKKPVCNRLFRSVGYFWENVTLAVEDNQLELIDKKGCIVRVLSPNIIKARNFNEGKACVQFINGLYGFINEKGRIEPYKFDYASDFSDDVAVVGNRLSNGNLQYSIINKAGKVLANLDINGIRILEHFHDRYLLCKDLTTNEFGLIDKKGQRLEITPAQKELINQIRKQPKFGNVEVSHLLTVVYDNYMNGSVVQSYSAKLPESAASYRTDFETQSINDLDSSRLQLGKAQQEKNAIKSRLEEAMKCMATNVEQAAVDRTDPAFRKVISDYVECFRVAYEEKNINFIRQVFSDDALIIVGKIIKSQGSDGGFLPQKKVEYNIRNKQEYLQRLAAVFKANRTIKLTFNQIKISRHPTKEGFYGVTLKQGYRSDLYSDEGYLFMLWDFQNPKTPQIHVRTWQPSMLDATHPLDKNAIFKIGDFTLE